MLILNRSSLPPRPAAETASPEIRTVVATIRLLPQHYRETIAPSAARLAQADPLARELGCVEADARSALSFLAANFLPSTRAEDLPGPTDRPAAQGG
jgi:hypothetical protein